MVGLFVPTRTLREVIFLLLPVEEVPTFQYRASDCRGAVVIYGLPFPRECPARFWADILGKFWASVRKEWFRRYGIDTVGLFFSYENDKTVTGSFDPNFAVATEEGIEAKVYQARFEETFDVGMMIFEDTLEAFLFDEENGYKPYSKLLKRKFDEDDEGPTLAELQEEMLNRFLASIGIRPVEKKRQRRKAQ